MELTLQDYKEALNVAMLYAQSITEDAAKGAHEPSERTNNLLAELVTFHGEAVKTAAAELNNPPR